MNKIEIFNNVSELSLKRKNLMIKMRETVLPRPKGMGFQKRRFLNYAFLACKNFTLKGEVSHR